MRGHSSHQRLGSQLHHLSEGGSFPASAQFLRHLGVLIHYFPEKVRAPPSNREIRYLYNLRGYKKGSPYVSLEAAVPFKPVLDLYSKFTMFKKEWFFIRDDSVSFRLFTSGVGRILTQKISSKTKKPQFHSGSQPPLRSTAKELNTNLEVHPKFSV